MKKKYIIKVFFVLLGSWSGVLHAQTGKQPNIVLILADDLGYGDVGCYGQTKIATPNIDQLAKDGIKFTQFYSGTSVCAPSRNSLMTGRHTGHTSVRGNKGTQPEGQAPLLATDTTIAQVLQQAGYLTGAFGKWGMGFITSTGDPNKKGFDQFYGYNCQSLAHNYYPDHLWNNHDKVDLSVNTTADSVYSGDLIHSQALAFINTKHRKPFFAFLPYTLPHGDVIAPKDSLYWHYVRKFDEQPVVERPGKYSNGKRTLEPYPHAAFAAMVARLDRYVGEVRKALVQQGLANNTLIIFASDNGPHRENGGDPEFFNSSGPLRGIKRDLYEGGMRVPFIACWPGSIKPGVSTQTGAFWDLFPTFAQLARVPAKPHLDGISIVPTLLKKGRQVQHEYLYWEFHENNGRQAVLWKNWKGVKYGVSKDANAPLQLFDLSKDVSEKNDVSAAHPDIVKRLNMYMAAAHVNNSDWPLLAGE